MACESPIWIRNRRYYDKKRPLRGLMADDDHRSALALRPHDIARQWLCVPCGKCPDCLRRLRNDWFVRLERELARCKHEKKQAIFITMTIRPEIYKESLADPSRFIRRFNERIRHVLGHSFKHAYFQEFGTHPETGGENRLHFHGFIFGLDCSYDTLRRAVSKFGFIWIGSATLKRARYVVKYVVKQINAVDQYGNFIPISEHKRYTRKFISPKVGDYLGTRRRPSATVSSWSYMDFKTRVSYDYTIPRYYDKYLSEKDKLVRELRSCDGYSRFSSSPLVKFVVDFMVKTSIPKDSLSGRDRYSWQIKKSREFIKAGRNDYFAQPPVWLSFDVLRYWKQSFNLEIPPNLLIKFKHLWQNNLQLVTS